MSLQTCDQHLPLIQKQLSPSPQSTSTLPWYAIRVRSNFEKSVAEGLRIRDYDEFTPFYRAKRRWSDRTKLVDFPLFPGYVFARFNPAESRPILQIPGVVSVVAFGNEPIAVNDEEIHSIRQLLVAGNNVGPWPYLRAGQRVRVRAGALHGIEGLLLEMKSSTRIVVSITLLQRSIAAEIDRDAVEPII